MKYKNILLFISPLFYLLKESSNKNITKEGKIDKTVFWLIFFGRAIFIYALIKIIN
jgi:hypothetical protein